MQDNSTYDNMIEELIRMADGELATGEAASMEKKLQEDESLKERYDNILAAKASIRTKGLQQRVAALHQEFLAEKNMQENTGTAKVIKPSFNAVKTFMRIAAIFILVVAGYGVYEFSSTSANSVYDSSYINYQLPVTRGENPQNTIDSLYGSANYAGVIQSFENTTNKTAQDYFLAAQSYLQTGNANAAVTNFKALQQLNNSSTEKYFVQETDYYLALAYIKAGNIDAAKQQLDLIKANKQHMFYQKASEISNMQLTILKWKE